MNKIEQAGKATLAGTVKQVTGLSTTTAGKLAALDQQFATTTKSTYSLSSMFSSLKTSVYNFYVNIPVAIGNFITRLRQWDASAWSWTLLVTFIFLIIFYFTSGFTAWTLADANKKAKSVSNQLTVLNDRMAILSSFSKLQKEFFTDMAKAKQVDPSTLSMLDIQPQTIKQIGYLGPQPEGTFDAEDATAQALLAGIRSFVFQIDYLDKTLNNKFAPPGIPCLLYRADDGALVSKNSADISKVAETLANLAFRPESPNHAAPLILYLHIRRAPSILREPDEYKEFLSRIATGLKPLAPQHLGMSPLGIFHRQKQESVLVSTPLKAFEGQVIILCNADTSVFRKGTRIDPADDLDYWVNMRVYLGDPKDTIGITQAPAPGVTPQAVIMNLANVSSMTEKQMDDFAITAKRAFIIAMPSQASNPTTTVLDTALNKLGIHMIPLDIFSHDIEETKSLIAEYNGMPFRSKAAFLRNSS
ncbi:hypothetical protein EBR66_02580 [bacterium]|nr:hypothetical protein [bacterium]